MMTFAKIFVAAGAVCAFAMAAEASTINVTYQEANVFGTPDYSALATVDSPGYDGDILAGPFRLTGDNGFGDFTAFCVDLFQGMVNGQSYVVSDISAFGVGVDNAIDRLFNLAYADIDSATEGAAFQLALWEIISDTGAGYDLGTGAFTVLSANAAVLNQAGIYLNGLAGAVTGAYKVTYLLSDSSQNLVTVSPVPLPAAGGMLLLGLGGLAALRRKRT